MSARSDQPPQGAPSRADGRVVTRTDAAFYLSTTRFLITLLAHVAVRREWQIVLFGQPCHQPPRQFRTVQERDTAQQRRDPEQHEHNPTGVHPTSKAATPLSKSATPSSRNATPISVHPASKAATPLSGASPCTLVTGRPHSLS